MAIIECTTYFPDCEVYDCDDLGTCPSYSGGYGPNTTKHNINNSTTIYICNVSLTLNKVTRKFQTQHATNTTLPQNLTVLATSDGPLYVECGSGLQSTHSAFISEDCLIHNTTLHYIDQRYNIVLYKEQIDQIKLYAASDKMAAFKTIVGTDYKHKILLKKQSFQGSYRQTLWRLAINGVIHTLSSTLESNWFPYTEVGGGKIWNPKTFAPDPNVIEVIVLPQPPYQAIALDDEVSYYGFYDYAPSEMGVSSELNKADGGCEDYYYPDWCRQMSFDPFWRKAADARYAATQNQEKYRDRREPYTPTVLVEPLPSGTYVKHPVVGELYQFLYDGKVVTSTIITELIDKQLALAVDENGTNLNLKTHDTTLYYPIGVI